MKCCDNPDIQTLDNPASDGVSYDVCKSCGAQQRVGIPDDALALMAEKDAEIERLSNELAKMKRLIHVLKANG